MSISQDQPEDQKLSRPLRWCQQFLGAVTFYTQIPVPHHWSMRFDGIARFAPVVGLGIGLGLVGVDWGLAALALPSATRGAVLVVLWLWITGGLHLDGAMDTADGLAVPDPSRRLDVMADSRAGAFGVMVAIALLGLKTVCLMDLETWRWAALPLAAGWGRWGQVVAIARYPYLREEGKGAFHKLHAHPATDWLWGFLPLLSIASTTGVIAAVPALWLIGVTISGCVIALAVGAWLQWQLGGHTGDTYGAIVEWTEALMLCAMVALQGWV